MNHRHSRVPALSISLLTVLLSLACSSSGYAQLSATEEERLQILSDPDAVKKKLEKDRNRAPFEFYRSQVAPFDILPYVKENHWSSIALELRANEEDFDGFLQSEPVLLLGMPQEIIYRREARLLKEARARLVQQALLTKIPKEWPLELVRPQSIRPEAVWQASLLPLESDQMLILILSKDSTNLFASWNRMLATIATSAERDNLQELDKLRYYRVVLPMDADKPPLSAHPLTWTTTSHVIWDALAPDVLSVSHQQAMLDWLHWGGQLIITGGAAMPYAVYRESFLGPYLPAEATGETVGLTGADLQPLSSAFPPPTLPAVLDLDENGQPVARTTELNQKLWRVYQDPAPIVTPEKRPIYFATLKPLSGASSIPFEKDSRHLLAVERRVGRGRITMLTFSPQDPALSAWRGIDTLVRRLILRRPEEPVVAPAGYNGVYYQPPRRARLPGADLSWFRIASREGSAVGIPNVATSEPPRVPAPADRRQVIASADPSNPPSDEQPRPPAVADWRDSTRFPSLARELLEDASGITVPSSKFVLQVILAYLIAIVPLNWLICRYGFNRREWAWVVVPILALGFAVGVQRGAAYDMGFDSASDEIDLIEIQADYPRAHLTRFVSLYSTGRSSYTISYPNNPTALALPLDNGRSIRGEQVSTSIWNSYPTPALVGMPVQPRSLSMFRAEEIHPLRGSIHIEPATKDTPRRVVNETEFELRDAVLIESDGGTGRTENYVGTINPGQALDLLPGAKNPVPDHVPAGPGPDPNAMLQALRDTFEKRPENQGEIRLVAWTPSLPGGQTIEPPVDRSRGFATFLVHLDPGALPDLNSDHYNLLVRGPETLRSSTGQFPGSSSQGTSVGSRFRNALSGQPPTPPSEEPSVRNRFPNSSSPGPIRVPPKPMPKR